MKRPQISILGCGWLGFALAKHFIKHKYSVKGSTTSTEKVSALQDAGIQPYVFTLGTTTNANLLTDFLENSEFIVINFPPKRVPDIVNIYPDQIRTILPYIQEHQKVIFVSSTSVYQNTNDWVSEELENHPEKESGKAVFAAEEVLREALQDHLTILRFAGLFGYDRVPGRFLATKKNLPNGKAPVNMIHRDDCIGLINAVITKNVWGEVINGCSDAHPIREKFYVLAAKKLGLQPPEFVKETSVSFKKISNIKSKMLLQYVYIYPNPLVFVV